MTLREQIKAIHAKHFDKEFHEYRGDLIPAMLNDLAEKFFDNLEFCNGAMCTPYDQDFRAIKRGRALMKTCGIREDTPAVE